MSGQQPSETVRTYCSECGGERNCDVFGSLDQSGGDEYFDWNTRWRLLRCRGCDHVFCQTKSTNSEEVDHEGLPNGEYTTFYIPTYRTLPAQPKRPRPSCLGKSDKRLGLVLRLWPIMHEVYEALDNDLHVLAAMGMRIVFDVSAQMLGVDPELPFAKKLAALFEKKEDRERLATLVDAGSASAHRGWNPSGEDLSTMMDVLEEFVHDAFVAPERRKKLDERLAALRISVPPRGPRKKRDTSESPAEGG